MSESVFASIRAWTWGSYEAGLWPANELGCATVNPAASEPAVATFVNAVSAVADLVTAGRFGDAGPAMRAAAAQVEDLLRRQPLDLLACFVEVVIRLRALAPEVATSLMSHAAAMARVYLPSPLHPLRTFLDGLAAADATDAVPLAAAAYACQLDVWRRIKNHGASNGAVSTWMTELSVVGGFAPLPHHLVPHLDDLARRLHAKMADDPWCADFYRRLLDSGNGRMVALDQDGFQVEFLLQPPGVPITLTGVPHPFAPYSLSHLNDAYRHFVHHEHAAQDALEARTLLATDIGGFLIRMSDGSAEWLEAWGEHEKAADVFAFRANILASAVVTPPLPSPPSSEHSNLLLPV